LERYRISLLKFFLIEKTVQNPGMARAKKVENNAYDVL